MALMGFYEYSAMVEDSPIDTFLVEYRDRAGVLTAVCLTDRTSDGLSAVYSSSRPRARATVSAIFVVLWLIEQARRLGLPYVYLGYWIADSAKMAYKAAVSTARDLGHQRLGTAHDCGSSGRRSAVAAFAAEICQQT